MTKLEGGVDMLLRCHGFYDVIHVSCDQSRSTAVANFYKSLTSTIIWVSTIVKTISPGCCERSYALLHMTDGSISR